MSLRGSTRRSSPSTAIGNGQPTSRSANPLVSAVAGLILLGLTSPAFAYQRPVRFELATVTSNGAQGRAPSGCHYFQSSIDHSGRFVAFESSFTNLYTNDVNQAGEIFVRDRKKGETELVSVTTTGLPTAPPSPEGAMEFCPGGGSYNPSISANGRFVAFDSEAQDLVPGDTNLARDVFIHDRAKGTTIRVSLSSDGTQAERPIGETALGRFLSQEPSISPDGRFVAFDSAASNLVDRDDNDARDVFVHDRIKRVTEMVSVPAVEDETAPLSEDSICPTISGGGRFVLFASAADNLVASDGNPGMDPFVHDRRTGKTEIVSVASDGSQGVMGAVTTIGRVCNGDHLISSNGRFVTFTHSAQNLVPNDNVKRPDISTADNDVFVHDRRSGRTELLSVTSFGEEATGNSWPSSISPDGRFVGFTSWANDLSEGDTGTNIFNIGDQDVFLHDRSLSITEMLSSNLDGEEAEGGNSPSCSYNGPATAQDPSVSSDARVVAFYSCATNLVATDTNDEWDVFVRDRGRQLGVGGLGGHPPEQTPPDDRICVGDVCMPPGAAVSSSDDTDDLDAVLTNQGANLYGASLAYRPQYSDLFAAIELEHMPKVLPGISPIFYGLRFKVEDRSYEVRASSLAYGTFGLFDCSDPVPTCTKVADLKGGYGTTGERVVFSLPLKEIGLENGGKLKDVTAFSGFGSNLTGATKALDTVRIK